MYSMFFSIPTKLSFIALMHLLSRHDSNSVSAKYKSQIMACKGFRISCPTMPAVAPIVASLSESLSCFVLSATNLSKCLEYSSSFFSICFRSVILRATCTEPIICPLSSLRGLALTRKSPESTCSCTSAVCSCPSSKAFECGQKSGGLSVLCTHLKHSKPTHFSGVVPNASAIALLALTILCWLSKMAIKSGTLSKVRSQSTLALWSACSACLRSVISCA